MFFQFFTFILFAQNEPKGQPFTCPPEADSLCCSQRTGDVGKSYPFRGVYTPLRDTPPSRKSALCSAARLREMAYKNLYYCEQSKDPFKVTI